MLLCRMDMEIPTLPSSSLAAQTCSGPLLPCSHSTCRKNPAAWSAVTPPAEKRPRESWCLHACAVRDIPHAPHRGTFTNRRNSRQHIIHSNGVLPASWVLVATSPAVESFRSKASIAFEISFLPQFPKTHCQPILPCPSDGSHFSTACWCSALCFTLLSLTPAQMSGPQAFLPVLLPIAST